MWRLRLDVSVWSKTTQLYGERGEKSFATLEELAFAMNSERAQAVLRRALTMDYATQELVILSIVDYIDDGIINIVPEDIVVRAPVANPPQPKPDPCNGCQHQKKGGRGNGK